MKPVVVIGVGMSPQDLTETHRREIERADVLIGGDRLLDFFKSSAAVKKEVTRDLSGVIDYIREQMHQKSVVVLASGDPLFFGIGSLLIKKLGPEQVIVYPNVNAVATAFARIKEPWQDAHVVSLHGRAGETALLNAVAQEEKIAVYTDPVQNPAWVAKLLLDHGVEGFDLCVLERLGAADEQIHRHTLQSAAAASFRDPNLVVLRRVVPPRKPERPVRLGAPDTDYAHDMGLITKAEVRAVTLSKLKLSSDHVLWDLGAGCGSVSIEAALFVTNGLIYAVEKNPDRIEQIKINRERYDVGNLYVVQATLPEGIRQLPRPDRIFVGGGGKDLDIIIREAAPLLKENGIMVINTVLLENVEASRSALKGAGLRVDVVQIQISRGRKMPWGERLEAQNPIWIVSGSKDT